MPARHRDRLRRNVVGSGLDWSVTTGLPDDRTLVVLRGLQRKLAPYARTADDRRTEGPVGYIAGLRALVGTRPLIMPGSTVVVLTEGRRILLQHRRDTRDWGTIGGALELGESFEEAARRELEEETGLTAGDLRFVTLLSGKDMYFKYPHGDEIYNVTAVFEATQVTGVPTADEDEGLELRYFPLGEPMLDLNSFSRSVLEKSGDLDKDL